MDATQFGKFAERRGISGFPTLHFYKNGAFVSEYEGDRTDRYVLRC
jgi:hypothetical protein